MGLFQNIISGIGNGISDIFGGGGNDDQKKRQQQQQSAPAPQFNTSPVKLPAIFQGAQQQPQQPNPLQLTHIGPAPQAPNPLAPQGPQAPAVPQINTQSYSPPADHQSLFSHLLHGAENVGEGALGLGAGAALGTLRAGEGLVQSAGELPNDVIHLSTLGANKAGLISDQTRNQINNNSTGTTNTALSPINWLANKTDEATGMFNHENGTPTITGRIARDIYTPAQVAVNAATVVPGVAAAATKGASLLGDTGKISDVLNGASDFVKSQSEIPNLSKVSIIGKPLEVSDETAGVTGEKAPTESGIKGPSEATNAPAGEENAPPEKAPNATETGIKASPTVAGGIIEPSDNTPAFMRNTSNTIGQAQFQAANGVNNIPDRMFDADQHVIQNGEPTSPLDVPTFMRNNAEVQLADAQQRIAQANQRIASIKGNSGRVGAFNDKQAIADAYRENLQKGKAVAALVGSKGERVDMEQALKQALVDRQQAVSDANAAQRAMDARTALTDSSKMQPTVAELGGSRPANDLQTQIENAHNAGDNAKVDQLITQLSPEMQTPMRSALGRPEPTAPLASQAAPTLTDTGDTGQNLQNAAALVRHTLENPRDFGAEEGAIPSDNLNAVIDKLNARPTDVVAETLGKWFGTHLTDTEAGNIEHAIQTGSTEGLSDKESTVVRSLVNDVEKPSDVSRSTLSTDYQSRENHFPQVREPGSVSAAVKAASGGKGLSGKVNTLEDVLNTGSRFSESSSLGKFIDEKGNTLIGDAPELGLKSDDSGAYTDGKKTYTYAPATSRELRNAGVKLQGPKDALTTYVKDTLAQKDRADAADYLKNNPEKVGLSKEPVPGKSTVIPIKGSNGKEDVFYTDNKTATKIQETLNPLRNEGSPLKQAFNKASSGVAQLTVMNPTVHTANLANNALIEAGAKYAKYAVDSKLDDNVLYEMRKGGTYTPSYGKNQVGILSKLTHGATKINEKVMSDIDLRIRYGMFRKLTEDDKLTPEQASKRINAALGGKSVYKNGEAQFGIFWHYFVNQIKFAGRILSQAAKGNIAPVVRAGIAAGLIYGADKGTKVLTGNSEAHVRPPGVLGIANDFMNSAKDVATGQYRNSASPVLNHVNPLIAQGAEQALGVDNYGNKFKTGQERVDNALSMTPVTNMAANNGHSVGEKALNTFGIYTPHIKGDMAVNPSSPGASVLNVKGAQNGASFAFPKDFTGEQQSNEVNKLGNNYSTKTAAIMGTQGLPQQEAIVKATPVLKKLGITSPTDIYSFSKMSPGDQADYVKAGNDLNKAGTSVSVGAIEKQLAENGKIGLAASLNKGIASNLSQNDKNALETYKIKGEPWLEDSTNAYNYYMADIKNKQSLDTLTKGPDKDTDMGTAFSGTGGTLYVKAAVAKTNAENSVSQTLQDLYYHTTKTEYEKMSGAQKDQLTAYARQLNNNGVIDKFGLATGTSGSSGSNRGGSSSASAASIDKAAGIPYGTISESFVKPTSDAGLKSTQARAYTKPTLAKYGPDTKGNPFVRSISVSSGVK